VNAAISPTDAAKNVVERARLNDQNAIATIAWVRQMAERGDVGFQKGLAAILNYAKKNPMKELVLRTNPIGVDGINAINILRRPNLSSRDHAMALSALPIVCPHNGLQLGSVTLMHGPPLNDERIGWLCEGYPSDETKNLFLHGVTNGHLDPNIHQAPPDVRAILLAGRCVGAGRALQVTAFTPLPITPFSPMLGWELGE